MVTITGMRLMDKPPELFAPEGRSSSGKTPILRSSGKVDKFERSPKDEQIRRLWEQYSSSMHNNSYMNAFDAALSMVKLGVEGAEKLRMNVYEEALLKDHYAAFIVSAIDVAKGLVQLGIAGAEELLEAWRSYKGAWRSYKENIDWHYPGLLDIAPSELDYLVAQHSESAIKAAEKLKFRVKDAKGLLVSACQKAYEKNINGARYALAVTAAEKLVKLGVEDAKELLISALQKAYEKDINDFRACYKLAVTDAEKLVKLEVEGAKELLVRALQKDYQRNISDDYFCVDSSGSNAVTDAEKLVKLEVEGAKELLINALRRAYRINLLDFRGDKRKAVSYAKELMKLEVFDAERLLEDWSLKDFGGTWGKKR